MIKVVGFITGFLLAYFTWWLSGADIFVRNGEAPYMFIIAILVGLVGLITNLMIENNRK